MTVVMLILGYVAVTLFVGGVFARSYIAGQLKEYPTIGIDGGDYTFGAIIGIISGALWPVTLLIVAILFLWFPDFRTKVRETLAIKTNNKNDEDRTVRKEIQKLRREYEGNILRRKTKAVLRRVR